MSRDLTAAHVTRLAREAVFGNARFTTTTITPGAFRVRAVSGVGGGDLDAVSQSNVLTEVRNHLIRFGYDASVSRQSSPRSHGTDAWVLTVIDAPRREREAVEFAAKLEAETGISVDGVPITETTVEQWGPDAVAVTREYDAEPVVIERQPIDTGDALTALGLCRGSRRRIPGWIGHDVRCPECGAWARLIADYGVAEHPAKAAEPARLCGLCGQREAALSHRLHGPGGHGFDALPEVEVGYVDPMATFDGVPYGVEEAKAHLAAGFALIGRHGGYRSCLVKDRRQDGRELGTVSAVVEALGRGMWVRFAAYRHDGSRVGYYDTRLGAAEGLRAESLAPEPTTAL